RTARGRAWVLRSRPDADPVGVLADLRTQGARRSDDEIGDQAVDRGPRPDLLGRNAFSLADGVVGVLVLAPLIERSGHVDVQGSTALGDRNQVVVDAAGVVDCGTGIAEGRREVDAVEQNVRGS